MLTLASGLTHVLALPGPLSTTKSGLGVLWLTAMPNHGDTNTTPHILKVLGGALGSAVGPG